MRLNQVITVLDGVKSKAERELTTAYQQLDKPTLLTGESRTYTPYEEGGEHLPSEIRNVQVLTPAVLKNVSGVLEDLFDVQFTQECANSAAKADIVVDAKVLLKDVPVTYILFLEKQIVNILTFVRKLPRLDPAETWTYDENTGFYVSKPVASVRTRKTQKPIVMYDATPQHPAQTQMITEDIKAGEWSTTKFSSALPADVVRKMTERVEKLQRAVKCAREEANSAEIENKKAGEVLLAYVFGV